jgi:hypothetical protein
MDAVDFPNAPVRAVPASSEAYVGMGVMTEDWLECIMADAAYRDQKFLKVQMVRLSYSCVMLFSSENEVSRFS